MSVRGVRHLLTGMNGYLSDRVFPGSDPVPASLAILPEGPESLQLIVEFRGKLIPVIVHRSDWNPFAGLGEASTGRAVAGALRRTMKQPETAPLRHIQFMDASVRKVPVGRVPDDWESLVLLVQQGASGRVFVAQRGGMDLAQQHELLKNTKFDDSLRWEDLDAALAALRHGHPLPNPASPLNDVARALWARTTATWTRHP